MKMAFEVRDLMMDVVAEHPRWEMGPCDNQTIPPPEPQPKRPPPRPKRNRVGIQAGALDELVSADAEMAPLALLRAQLHQALHP
jgi:hypothetical protein